MKRHIKIADVTLRDGQQSLTATRMKTDQALKVLSKLDKAGFAALELWGGATLDSCIRFLDENPWDRLEQYRNVLGSGSKIRALLRGQNLFAYQPFPDDLVIAFIKQAVESGVGIMRIFDALNDWRNLQIPILAAKAYGAVIEPAICYTTSPVHTIDYFVNLAKNFENEGADRIAIKDMAGLLNPVSALELFKRFEKEIHLPVTFHIHDTTGFGLLNNLIAMNHNIDMIDCTVTPFAGGTAHPPAELVVLFAEEMGFEHDLDKDLLLEIQRDLFEIYEELQDHNPFYGKYYRPYGYEDVNPKMVQQISKLVLEDTSESIEKAIPLCRELMQSLHFPEPDLRILEAQIPGGMLSNLYSQLEQMGQPDIIDKVLEEVPRVRADFGYVTLVTPTSQIIGSQATFNVMTGQRYGMLSNESRMLLRGEFGKPPAPFNPELVQKAFEEGKEMIEFRPASYLKPVLESDYHLPFIKTNKDLLLHLMLGENADTFLKKQYQTEPTA